MDMSSVNSDIIRGNVTTIILNTLAKNGGYGYDILKQIETNTLGVYKLKSATVYNKLNRLEEEGLVSSVLGDAKDTSGAQRRYYKLTEEGRKYLEKEKEKYRFSRTILDNLVSSDEFNLNHETPPFDPTELRPYTKKEKDPEQKPKIIYKDKIIEKIVEVEKPVYIEKEVIKPVIQEKIVEIEKPIYIESKQGPKTIDELDIPSSNTPKLTLLELYKKLKAETEKEPESTRINKVKPRKTLDNLKTFGDETAQYEYEKSQSNYKDFYQELNNKEFEIDADEEDLSETFHTDIKTDLYANGFKLRAYNKKNSSEFYDLNFLFVNRIKRDLSFIFFAIVAIELAVFWVSLYKHISYVYFMPVSIISLILALSPIVIYLANPHKRVRDRFNFKLSLLLRFIISLNLIGASIIIAFFVPEIKIADKYHRFECIIIPAVLFANLPLSSFLNLLLIKSKKYHTA